MNEKQIQALIDFIKSASLLTIDDSPFIVNYDASDPIGEEDNEVFNFHWKSDEFEYSVTITEIGLSNANFKDNQIRLNDHEGTHTVITLFSVNPLTVTKTW